MEQWGFYFDQTRCVNCKTCILACKAWNHEKRGDKERNPACQWLEQPMYEEPASYENLPGSTGEQNYGEYSKYHMKENLRRVESREYGAVLPNIDTLNLSVSCNHCEQPACISACPQKRIYKEKKYGIVTTDETIPCTSCRRCQKACPWQSPRFYDESPYYEEKTEQPPMIKCDLCIERIQEGLKPACAAGCIMRALEAGPIKELQEKYPDSSLLEHKLHPNILIKEKKRKVWKEG